MKLNFDKFLTEFNDYHLPFAGVVYVVGSVLQWFHHLDASYVAFCATVLGFVGGHAYINSTSGGVDSTVTSAVTTVTQGPTIGGQGR